MVKETQITQGFAGDMNVEREGHGMFSEADKAVMALVNGRKEGKIESLGESIAIMEVMDQVRRQNESKFPDRIETTERVGL